jgi:S-adenosylmethionine:tRNA ribosyltransferase-isomerase
LPDLLRPGDCLVLNDSRVLPARLWLRRPGGGQAELLLIAPRGQGAWEVMARPARKLEPGLRLALPGDGGEIEFLPDPTGDPRTRLARFYLKDHDDLIGYLERHGEMPLPPYILQQRKARGEAPRATAEDLERYQTVYARRADAAAHVGSIAAPTAGLHFTPELLAALEARQVEIRRVTLHVGLGTFEPVEEDDPTQHRMHEEFYSIDAANAQAIEAARLDPARRVVAVGTTATRALEACMARHGRVVADSAVTSLFIYPGYRFRVVEAMATNFHLPRSTLLMLVGAFAGRERLLACYCEAVERHYRFFSYGDAMFLE